MSQPSVQQDLGLFDRGEMNEIRERGVVRVVEIGTVVAAAGSSATHVQIVMQGELELMARLPRGRATMGVIRSGGVILDIPMLLHQPMPFDAIASRRTEVVALSRRTWKELLASSPTLTLRWMTPIAWRLDADRRRLVIVTSRPLVAQVAYLLLELGEGDETGQCVVRLSHLTMAQLLGARRQSVTRVLAELRRQGMVSTRYGTTVLEDRDRLRQVMGSTPLP
jgi:CRP-like cAMP-binding protein